MRAASLWIPLSLCLAGCSDDAPNPRFAFGPTTPDPNYDPYALSSDDIKFLEHAETNTPLEGDLFRLQFTSRQGEPVDLKDVAPGKTLILVMTRGYNGAICPYCSTQVSRLIANYGDIERRNAEVVVVYPLQTEEDSERTDEFVARAVSLLKTSEKKEVPFPLVLDFNLKVVDSLGLRKDLSKPATYILDAEGRLQFAYVGNTLADRPSVAAVIEQLDKINQQEQRS